MFILQLLNIFIGLLFLAVLTAHLAKKQGLKPLPWFCMTFLLGGLIPLLALYFLNRLKQKRAARIKKDRFIEQMAKEKEIVPSFRDMIQFKRWYYLDGEQRQIGPLEFTDLTKVFQEKQLAKGTFVWGEGMENWQKLEELPDLEEEITKYTLVVKK